MRCYNLPRRAEKRAALRVDMTITGCAPPSGGIKMFRSALAFMKKETVLSAAVGPGPALHVPCAAGRRSTPAT